ncbi:NYN domain-containing protein [Dongia sp.]|uniref:NYN domain-containing protein n=1 Tax=Dongia sp. TaxID=1977262 RepID=UPI0035AF6D4C
MDRTAILVDAGYLFAQGSALLKGAKQPRTALSVVEEKILELLITESHKLAPRKELLRIYWYDAPPQGNRPSGEQSSLAHRDHVKLRLGFLNGVGQQKGVDSLIVTDMIELARNHAVSDIVLISGDEDVRVGVQIAQSYGVRVHLLGISPARGSQSLALLQEADTTTEWDRSIVESWLLVKEVGVRSEAKTSSAPASAGAAGFSRQISSTSSAAIPAEVTQILDSIAAAYSDGLDPLTKAQVKLNWENNHSVPPEHDGRLLARARTALQRDLDPTEKRHIRKLLASKAGS